MLLQGRLTSISLRGPTMLAFIDVELSFLYRYGLDTDDVYDGRGESKRTRERRAKEEGKTLIFASACRVGHRLKTRSGHCAQCNPINIAFQDRYNAYGYVYIAGSLSGRAIKFGNAGTIEQRENQLRAERYGGLRDWRVLFHVKVNERGRVEHNARASVQGYQVIRSYEKNGFYQTAVEMIRCPFSAALRSLQDTIGDNPRRDVWQSSNCDEYEFILDSNEE